MLGNYERRYFTDGEKVWFGRYRHLTNVLHWHFECEIIRIVSGNAQIKIGDYCFNAQAGDCFFCAGEQLHYIISESDILIEVIIIDKSIAMDITDVYTLISPKLPDSISIDYYFFKIEEALSAKGMFYHKAIENYAEGLIIEIFQNCTSTKHPRDTTSFYKNLISRINDEFSFITFEEAVRTSGYSPAHFSKVFKKLSGMTFSKYLNIVKIEHAIMLMRSSPMSITSISLECGFTTVRNFNRVFKSITGYSPSSLPKDFIIDTGLQILRIGNFDPTRESSKLV